jgi:hypothetical protein
VEEYLLHGLAFIYTSSFHTGDELISTMENHVRSSWIFALFASQDSLESHWVRFEIDQARLANITRADHKILVFPASKSIQSTDLPAWIRRYWFEAEGRTAKDIARYINNQVRFSLLYQRVYGRGKTIDAATSRFSQHIAQARVVPNTFFFSGLHHVCKKSSLSRLCPNINKSGVGRL